MPPYPYHMQLAFGEKSHPHPADHPGIGNDLGISNRGAFSLATQSHSITAVHWVRQHRGDSDTDFLLLNACSVNGVLCLTLCYKHPIVDEATIVAIADGLLDRLVVAAGVPEDVGAVGVAAGVALGGGATAAGTAADVAALPGVNVADYVAVP
eukprot:UN0847